MYVMAILGCGDAGGLCSQARIDPARYPTMAACQAAAPTILARHADLDFPEIATRCRAGTNRDLRQIASARPRG